MTEGNPKKAFATLITSDNYLPGAIALSHSLSESGSTIPTVVLSVLSNLSSSSITALNEAFDEVIDVNTLFSDDADNLQLLGRFTQFLTEQRVELDVTYTKLHVWNLLNYDIVAFLDADTICVSNIDDIFGYVSVSEIFAAAPDIGWPV